jgi:hypothetical protein
MRFRLYTAVISHRLKQPTSITQLRAVTGACQACLTHGTNFSIPYSFLFEASRKFEKKLPVVPLVNLNELFAISV